MSPDILAALAAYVSRNAVSSARIVAVIPDALAVECSAADGSRWHVTTDRYARAYGWHATLSGAVADLAADLYRRAARYELAALTADADGDPDEAERQREWWRTYLAAADTYAARADLYRAAELAA